MYKILIGIILAGSVFGYYYYNSTQAKLEELHTLNQAYEIKFNEQEKTITFLQKDFALQAKSLQQMELKNLDLQNEINRYLDIFNRHDLTKLAAAKPGLVESRANAATKEVFDGIEADSADLNFFDNRVQFSNRNPSRN